MNTFVDEELKQLSRMRQYSNSSANGPRGLAFSGNSHISQAIVGSYNSTYSSPFTDVEERRSSPSIPISPVHTQQRRQESAEIAQMELEFEFKTLEMLALIKGSSFHAGKETNNNSPSVRVSPNGEMTCPLSAQRPPLSSRSRSGTSTASAITPFSTRTESENELTRIQSGENSDKEDMDCLDFVDVDDQPYPSLPGLTAPFSKKMFPNHQPHEQLETAEDDDEYLIGQSYVEEERAVPSSASYLNLYHSSDEEEDIFGMEL